MEPQALPLRDIHLPDAILWWPPALGWWLLLLLLVVVPLLIWAVRAWRRRGQLKRDALTELQQIETQFNEQQNPQQLLMMLSALLRRIAISRYPHNEVASLTGSDWLAFLNGDKNKKIFADELADALLLGPYQAQCEVHSEALLSACREWIKQLPAGGRA